MIVPQIEATPGRVAVAWPDPLFATFEFDLFRAERSGEVTAELLVKTTAPGLHDRLHQARLNLTSTRGRVELTNLLKKRHGGPDWDGLVEGSVMLALRQYRDAEPAILLRDAQRPPDAGWLLPPLVLGRLPTILFGDGGTGKSLIALAAALTIHMDRSDLLGLTPASTRTVAYLDWELEDWEQRERMRSLVGEQMPDLVYRRCVGPLRDQVDPLRRMIRDHGIRFVVIDSIGPAAGGPPEDASVALGFFEALRALGVGALCIAHVTKDGNTEKPFGSSFWHNGARATWYAKRETTAPGADGFTVGLYNRKSNVDRLVAPLAFDLMFDEDRVTITRSDIRDNQELAATLPLRYRMQHALKAGAKTYAELAVVLDAPVDSVKKAVDRDRGNTFTRFPGPDDIYRVGLVSHAG
jgi:hypothetical protein